jgi:hypothetical protein
LGYNAVLEAFTKYSLRLALNRTSTHSGSVDC